MKNSNDTIGNRTRDIPACSAVPQPTAPPRAPGRLQGVHYSKWSAIQATSTHFGLDVDLLQTL